MCKVRQNQQRGKGEHDRQTAEKKTCIKSAEEQCNTSKYEREVTLDIWLAITRGLENGKPKWSWTTAMRSNIWRKLVSFANRDKLPDPSTVGSLGADQRRSQVTQQRADAEQCRRRGGTDAEASPLCGTALHVCLSARTSLPPRPPYNLNSPAFEAFCPLTGGFGGCECNTRGFARFRAKL